MEKKKVKKKKKKSEGLGFWRMIFKTIKIFLILFFGLSIFFTLLYKWVNPPITMLMVQKYVEKKFSDKKDAKIEKEWVSYNNISPLMIKAVIASEDNLFVKHYGFDAKAIEQAIEYNKKGKKIRGASTISQQTAKNVFLWSGRSWVRKGLEVYFTFLIETIWGKKRIMEVYLNVIEFGDGIYGVEKAAKENFGISARNLNKNQSALLASVLPSPLKRNAKKPTRWLINRAKRVERVMSQHGNIILD
ncbi:MAG: monofunctional biosynthetic peptidoglycan transglycosylase [Bacteroidales bacterium]|jgi:monofunctional biosynthetic peptidoglycan transglycosylase|nr:monofunctional biosynthetic peptidoglycan transglycosylase [Bacteroidales bacterium]